MYNLQKNNYHLKPKNSTIYTPKEVSEFIFEILNSSFCWKEYDYDHPQAFQKKSIILDPCSGRGSLLEPWKNRDYKTLGIDISKESSADIQTDFLSLEKWEQEKPALIVCNPPFNGYGRQLASEVWLAKIIELFGKEIPLVLFTPVGLRNNLTLQSQRHQKFANGDYPAIRGIITLPKNIFSDVVFHSEILLFNIKGLKSHYYLPKYNSRQLINQRYYQRNQDKIKLVQQQRYSLKKSLNNPIFSLNKLAKNQWKKPWGVWGDC